MNKGITVMYYQGFNSASPDVMILLVLAYSLSWYAKMGDWDCWALNYVTCMLRKKIYTLEI